MIVRSGLNKTAQICTSTWSFFNVGTDSGTTSISHTDLSTPISPRTWLATMSFSTNSTYYVIAKLTKSQNNSASNIVECGVFDAVQAGNMLFRSTSFTATTKTTSISLIASVAITFST